MDFLCYILLVQHIIPHRPEPRLDPTNMVNSMVHIMQKELTENVPMERVLGPLPENAFVVAARDSIPQPRARVTTASTRGNLRGRGRGRSSARSNAGKDQASSSRGRRKATGTSLGPDEDSPAARGRKARRVPTSTANTEDVVLVVSNASGTFIPDLNALFLLEEDAQEVPLSQNAPPPAEEI